MWERSVLRRREGRYGEPRMAQKWESGRRLDQGRTMWGEEPARLTLPVPRDGKRPLPPSWWKEHGTKDRGGDRAHPSGRDQGRAVHQDGEGGARAVSEAGTGLSGGATGDLRPGLTGRLPQKLVLVELHGAARRIHQAIGLARPSRMKLLPASGSRTTPQPEPADSVARLGLTGTPTKNLTSSRCRRRSSTAPPRNACTTDGGSVAAGARDLPVLFRQTPIAPSVACYPVHAGASLPLGWYRAQNTCQGARFRHGLMPRGLAVHGVFVAISAFPLLRSPGASATPEGGAEPNNGFSGIRLLWRLVSRKLRWAFLEAVPPARVSHQNPFPSHVQHQRRLLVVKTLFGHVDARDDHVMLKARPEVNDDSRRISRFGSTAPCRTSITSMSESGSASSLACEPNSTTRTRRDP